MANRIRTLVATIALSTLPLTGFAESKTPQQSTLIENALSVVGKVRYVWGGGHIGTAEIKGISPIWEPFNQKYTDMPPETTLGVEKSHWCPVHGTEYCAFSDYGTWSVIGLIDSHLWLGIEPESLENTYSSINWEDRPQYKNDHRFDGLDCSGYITWLAYQTLEYYPSLLEHMDFSQDCDIVTRDDFEPGDFIEFNHHTYVLIGQVTDNCWIHAEATPGVLRLGVTYWGDKSGIPEAVQLINRYYLHQDLSIEDPHREFDLDALPGISDYSTVTYGRLKGISLDLPSKSAYDILNVR